MLRLRLRLDTRPSYSMYSIGQQPWRIVKAGDGRDHLCVSFAASCHASCAGRISDGRAMTSDDERMRRGPSGRCEVETKTADGDASRPDVGKGTTTNERVESRERPAPAASLYIYMLVNRARPGAGAALRRELARVPWPVPCAVWHRGCLRRSSYPRPGGPGAI